MRNWLPWLRSRRARSNDEELARIVDEIAEKICRGETIDWSACSAQYPEHSTALHELAVAMNILVEFGVAERSAD